MLPVEKLDIQFPPSMRESDIELALAAVAAAVPSRADELAAGILHCLTDQVVQDDEEIADSAVVALVDGRGRFAVDAPDFIGPLVAGAGARVVECGCQRGATRRRVPQPACAGRQRRR